MLVAVQYVQLLAPRGSQKLASRCFSDPCFANEKGGLAVLEAPLEEVISALSCDSRVRTLKWRPKDEVNCVHSLETRRPDDSGAIRDRFSCRRGVELLVELYGIDLHWGEVRS